MMPVKNKTIEDYVLGRCNAQQMEELLAWAKGANKRMHWLFALRDAFLNMKYQHAFDDKAIVDIAEETPLQGHCRGARHISLHTRPSVFWRKAFALQALFLSPFLCRFPNKS